MKIAVYSTKQYDKKYLQNVNEAYGFELEFLISVNGKNRKNRPWLRSGLYFRQRRRQPSGSGRVKRMA
jgi:hypothetical protein